MPKRLPISAAKRFANENDCRQVIIVAFDDDGITHVVTYGKTLLDCEQAAVGGNKIKQFLGFPDALCHDVPARVKRLQRTTK